MDPAAKLDPDGLPDWFTANRFGVESRREMRELYLTAQEMDQALYDYAS